MNYYTYAYLREDGTPYYIGKGTEKRIYKTHRRVKQPKDKSRIIFLKQNLTEEEAFKHEIYMIAVFGRKDNGTGILRNRSDGGEGVSNPSVETRKKKSVLAKKQMADRTSEQRSEIGNKMREGLSRMSPEQRNKIIEALKKGNAKITLEQRSESARKSWANKTPEQRSELARKRNESMTPEQRSERTRKGVASRTPEQRSERGRKTCSQRWQCTETGYVNNPASLSHYQNKRGIDTSKRIRLS